MTKATQTLSMLLSACIAGSLKGLLLQHREAEEWNRDSGRMHLSGMGLGGQACWERRSLQLQSHRTLDADPRIPGNTQARFIPPTRRERRKGHWRDPGRVPEGAIPPGRLVLLHAAWTESTFRYRDAVARIGPNHDPGHLRLDRRHRAGREDST